MKLLLATILLLSQLQAGWSILSPSMSSAAEAIKADVQSKFQTHKKRIEDIKNQKNTEITRLNKEKIIEYNKYLIINKKNALIQKKLQFTTKQINNIGNLIDDKE